MYYQEIIPSQFVLDFDILCYAIWSVITPMIM